MRLKGMLNDLLADPSVGTVHIVAHSMGTMVAIEALRQLYDSRAASIANRFGALVLASPDIDLDGFTSSIIAHAYAFTQDHGSYRGQ